MSALGLICLYKRRLLPSFASQNPPPSRKEALFIAFFFDVAFAVSYDEAREVARVERYQWVEIMPLAEGGFIGCDRDTKDYNSQNKSPNFKHPHESEYQHTHKLKRVSELVILLSEVRYCYECHIEYHVGTEPTYAHSKITEQKRADDR